MCLLILPSLPVQAQDDCGAAINNMVTCNSGSYNPSSGGIRYLGDDGLTLNVDLPGTDIATSGTGDHGVFIDKNSAISEDVTININSARTITATGFLAHGVFADVDGSNGSAVINIADGTTVSAAGPGGRGVFAAVGVFSSAAGNHSGDAMVNMTGGSVSTVGGFAGGTSDRFAFGISSYNNGIGAATTSMSGGSVSTTGGTAFALRALITHPTSTATATSSITGGTITTTGSSAIPLYAQHDGQGDTLVTIAGNSMITTNTLGVRSRLFPRNTSGTARFTMSGGQLTTPTTGVEVDTFGAGTVAVDVETTGGRIDAGGVGITALNRNASPGATGDIVVSLGGELLAGSTGLNATHSGLGNIDIDTTGGSIEATGAGIAASLATTGAPGNITIDTAAPITGGSSAIAAATSGPGRVAITVGGDLSGGSVNAINAFGVDDSTIDITINNGTVTASSGEAIHIVNAGSTISVNGGTVDGEINLDGGNDSVHFNGGSFSQTTAVDGDEGDDILRFTNTSGVLMAATNIESVEIGPGATIGFSSGTLTTTLQTMEGGTLNAAGGFTLTGTMDNSGTISTIDNNVGDVVTISGAYSANSNLKLDAVLDNGSGGADQLILNGTATGTTEITINNTMPGLGAATGGDGILLVSTSSGGDFILAGEVRDGDYVYSLVPEGNDWYLQSSFSPAPTGPERIPTLSHWYLTLLAGFMVLLIPVVTRKIMPA